MYEKNKKLVANSLVVLKITVEMGNKYQVPGGGW